MKIKNSHVSIGLLILILSLSVAGTINQSFKPRSKLETPKTSDGEITIVSPENKTYNALNRGHYPGTYSFENEPNGYVTPADWTLWQLSGTEREIYAELDGHKKVYGIYDANWWERRTIQTFTDGAQSTGTIEFYMRTDDVSQGYNFDLYYNFAPPTYLWSLSVGFSDSKIMVWNGSSNTILDPAINDRWYHVRIDFRMTGAGSYLGLDANSARVYIDRIDMGTFNLQGTNPSLTEVHLKSPPGAELNHNYIDALGYSWDTNYNIGDNIGEDLLLNFESSVNLDWIGYSLDGQSNETILGNTTIPIPSDGPHTLKVFGNDSLGTNYQSDLRHFSVSSSSENIEEWQYFREINLNPSTPESDYQVKVQLNNLNFNYSKANPDGSDMRFLDQNQNQLSYWVEKWNDSGNSIIWVKIPTSGTSKIYMYYGNPIATSLSDGINTFEFFDDFEGTSLNASKWNTEIGTYCGISVSSGYVRLYSDSPNTFVEAAFFGFTDQYFIQGTPYSWVHPSESVCITLAEDTTWHTNEIRWTNLTSAPYYKNDVYVSEDTTLEDITLTVRFIAHSAYSGPGTPWGAWIWTDDNTLGQMGRGLRTKTSVDLTDISDLRVDWVAVFKYSELNPVVTIGLENTLGPEIIINAPIANSLYGTLAPLFNITITDPDYNFTWYSLDGGSTNVYSNETIGTIDQTEWDKQSNGTVTITFYANNSLGDIGHTAVTVRKDILAPLIMINSPSENQVCGVDAPTFDLTILEHEIDTTWYTLDYGSVNISFSGSTGTIDQTEWAKKGGGTVPIRFYANDSFGNVDFSEVIVVKDLISPIVSINLPGLNEIFGSTPPNFDITVSESNPDSMWYSLDSGATIITFGSLSGTIDQTEWDKQGNGTITIKFYVRDEGGNEGFAEIIVRKDINIPLITINAPITDDIFGLQPPQYDISVVEPNIDTMWYTLDFGVTLIPFTEFMGTIDQIEWNKFSDGIVIIRFYVRDKGDNEAFAEVSVSKDLIAPVITINEPEFAEVFVDISPYYSISIYETSLDSYWYSLDGGQMNHSISELIGAIDQSAWDSVSDGHITLTFYAKDEAGNVGYSSVSITKRSSSEPIPPGIPGYNLIALIGVTLAITLILAKRKLKK